MIIIIPIEAFFVVECLTIMTTKSFVYQFFSFRFDVKKEIDIGVKHAWNNL